MAILKLIGTVILAALVKVAADDLKAWFPFFQRRLLEKALSRLPEDQRERYGEEWAADLTAIPGDVAKLFYALGFLRAAVRISGEQYREEAHHENRGFDLSFSLFILPSFSFLLILIGALVKLSSTGPILFKQRRVGRDGRPFFILRFRTIRCDAVTRLKTYLERDPDAHREWTEKHMLKKDPRFTSLGVFLRRFNLEDAPQLLNVLAGDMSLVGPRPRSEAEINQMQEHHRAILSVRPGIISPFSVSSRFERSVDECDADLEYVEGASFFLNIKILVRTFVAPLPPGY